MKLTWIVAARFVQGVPIQKAADIMMTVQVVNVKSMPVAGLCTSCHNGIIDGFETGVDCGGQRCQQRWWRWTCQASDRLRQANDAATSCADS